MNRIPTSLAAFIGLLAMLFSSLLVQGQNGPTSGDSNTHRQIRSENEQGIEVFAQIVEGDTFPLKYLPYVTVVADRKFRDPAEERKWRRLKKNVKKVYPYARLAAQKLEEYADELASVESERERKRYYKRIENELKEEYEGDMRDLTVTQGRILIKLIDRETGNTSYRVVKEFRGGLSAFFWQGLARMFGQDLKSEYDPYGEDKDIETVVQLIESGNL